MAPAPRDLQVRRPRGAVQGIQRRRRSTISRLQKVPHLGKDRRHGRSKRDSAEVKSWLPFIFVMLSAAGTVAKTVPRSRSIPTCAQLSHFHPQSLAMTGARAGRDASTAEDRPLDDPPPLSMTGQGFPRGLELAAL